MHNNYAFVFRLGGGANGSHFMGYVPAARPNANSILLDATADIDKVSDLCSWRTQVAVPPVHYDRLHIVHADHYTQENLTEFFRNDSNRRKYAEGAKRLILDVMPPGACGLIVCKKRLVDQGLFPEEATKRTGDAFDDQRFPWDFEGRHLAVTWWGGHGIGANDWRKAWRRQRLAQEIALVLVERSASRSAERGPPFRTRGRHVDVALSRRRARFVHGRSPSASRASIFSTTGIRSATLSMT